MDEPRTTEPRLIGTPLFAGLWLVMLAANAMSLIYQDGSWLVALIYQAIPTVILAAVIRRENRG